MNGIRFVDRSSVRMKTMFGRPPMASMCRSEPWKVVVVQPAIAITANNAPRPLRHTGPRRRRKGRTFCILRLPGAEVAGGSRTSHLAVLRTVAEHGGRGAR